MPLGALLESRLIFVSCHSGETRNPVVSFKGWIPACAGMTNERLSQQTPFAFIAFDFAGF